MAGARRLGVRYILERERDVPPEQRTVWVLDEAGSFNYEQYSASTVIETLDKRGRKLKTRIPHRAKVELVKACLNSVENFDGKDANDAKEIKAIVKDKMRQPDLDELCQAVTDISTLSDGEAKNFAASSDSNDSSTTSQGDEATTTAKSA